jgi:hypothetical protein
VSVDCSYYYNQWRPHGALGYLIWRCMRPSKLWRHRALPHRGTTISAQTLKMTRYQLGRYAALVKYGSKNGELLRA